MNRQQRRVAARSSRRGTAAPAAATPLRDALTGALGLHRTGHLEEAEAVYRDVLAAAPSNADALHLLGVVLTQTGRAGEAMALIRRAITAGGESAGFLSSLAVACRTAGRSEDAEAACRRALALEPGHAEALVNLGNLLADRGRRDEAAAAYEAGVAAKPGSVAGWVGLARAREALGRPSEAKAAFERALSLAPEHADASMGLGDLAAAAGDLPGALERYRRLARSRPEDALLHDRIGVMLQRLGHGEEALAAHERAVALEPNDADLLSNLGIALQRAGRVADAVEAYQGAIACRPHSPEAHNNLGNALRATGRMEAAEHVYRRATELDAGCVEAWNNLGVCLGEVGRLEEAEEALRRAVAQAPAYAEAHNNLGHVLRRTDRREQAKAAFRRAAELKPDFAEPHYDLANMLAAEGEVEAAIASHRRALAVRPEYPEAMVNLGVCLQDRGRLAEAVAAYDGALSIAPSLVQARNNIGIVRMMQGRLDEAEAAFREAEDANREAARLSPAALGSNRLFCMNYNPGHDAAALFEAHRDWARRFAPARATAPFRNRAEPDRRLRVGYVSPDFREHAVAFFFLPLLENHDRAAVEVHCYAEVAQPDQVSERIAAAADGWVRTVGLSDEALAARIREDGIDLLVDMAGHTKDSRLPVFAHRPAPVQVSWLGYPTTTGLAAMDHKLSDAHLTPRCSSERFTEAPLNLPDSFLCYAPPADAPDVAPDGAASGRPITFGSFNVLSKINPQVVALWAAVLRAVPESRLMLKTKALDDGPTREHLRGLFAREGVAPSRLLLDGHKAGIAEHLAAYAGIDIALDPFPYNGGTTTLEALWMGVPAISLAGERSAARHGLSILTSLGLPELAARTPEAYVRLAATLAADHGRRAALRAGMRLRLAGSPLCNGRRFARNVENAYREAWRRWCARSAAQAADAPVS